ncbi:MFS transporter [Accumulibacter sp.]|uniref:MFS transporter n=1 Tax=Accumulibacter sp. TaxID=2053492 RepID=UPI0025F8CC08|nr:MFS transporter [Accumulibacter sp.]MCM8594181.1 MFS transporter [Accumulibacter sp.]MCM8625743.1 MFS transporter [Accumulibacter sp.]MDS4048324.1 MFS transporter [Accumulibacter sp.]
MSGAVSAGLSLTRGQMLAYGALGLPLAMAALPVYVHLPRLYAEATGLSLGLLGVLLLFARLFDAGIDPLLGGWVDRAGTRRRLVVVALPFLALGIPALFHPPQSLVPLWLLFWLTCTYFGFSLATVAHQAWGAELGCSPGERTRLTASREGFGLIGVIAAAAVPAWLASDFVAGISGLAQLFPGLLLVFAAWTWFGSPPTPGRLPPRRALLGELGHALRHGRFRLLLAAFVLNGLAAALPATLVLFFVADVLHAEEWSGVFLAVYFASGVFFLPLWVRLAGRCGRVRSWVVSMLVAIAAFAWAWRLGSGDVWPFLIVCLLSGAALGADLTLPPALLADLAEDSPAADPAGERQAQAGAYFGWWNLVAKLNLALAAGLALPLVEALGYRPGAAEGAEPLAIVYGLLPLLFKLAAAALAWRWRDLLEPSR